MTIRKKIILFSAVALGAFLAAVFLLSRFALTKGLARLESETSQNTIHQMRSALLHKQSNLETVAHDYAQNDTTYEFLQDRSSDYGRTTLTPDALKALHVDFAAVFDSANSLVFYRTDGSWPTDVLQLQAILNAGLRQRNNEGILPSRGILQVNGHVLMLSYQSVLPASGIGVSRGTLLLGYAMKSLRSAG